MRTSPACFRVSIIGALLALSGTCNAGEMLHLSLVDDQIDYPVYLTAPPGDDRRLFVVDQYDGNGIGRIRIIEDGALLATPFLEVGPVATHNSTGLLCMAFAPDYDRSGHFYVVYNAPDLTVVISRYTVSADPGVADGGSEQVLLTIPQPIHIHQGGWLGFGPDGYLYVSSGDGGGQNDPDHRGQDPDSMLGKLLRIDVSGADDFPADPLRNYAIPGDNPFVGLPPLDEIWALGLREVWRASFDRFTGDLYLADVGQDSWEEIDFEPGGFGGGANYGWRCREGDNPHEPDPECGGATFTAPIHEYDHSGGRCAIIGGYVYRGTTIDGLAGKYLYADNCTGQVSSLRYDGAVLSEATDHPLEVDPDIALGFIASFGEDACGELYLLTRSSGIFKFVDAAGDTGVCSCPWDLDGGGAVDTADLLALLSAWGDDPGGPPDFDADGSVGTTDLLALLAAWGPCTGS